jgi:hypothetical protein
MKCVETHHVHGLIAYATSAALYATKSGTSRARELRSKARLDLLALNGVVKCKVTYEALDSDNPENRRQDTVLYSLDENSATDRGEGFQLTGYKLRSLMSIH